MNDEDNPLQEAVDSAESVLTEAALQDLKFEMEHKQIFDAVNSSSAKPKDAIGAWEELSLRRNLAGCIARIRKMGERATRAENEVLRLQKVIKKFIGDTPKDQLPTSTKHSTNRQMKMLKQWYQW